MPVAGECNVFGYLARSFVPLSERPLTDVDSLVLSCLAYFRPPREATGARGASGMAVRDLFRADWLEPMTHGLWDPEGLARLLAAVVASPRLGDVRVCWHVDDFDEAAEKQFSATTVLLPTGDAYVAFRGTDNTLVGWKEDFNMAFEANVPSQLAARDYLERVVPRLGGRVFVGGHSKGGNLAVFAASTCADPVAARVARVFSHDGPGFLEQVLAAPRWQERSRLVSKTVPRSSFVGMFLERQEDYVVVESSSSGLAQHDPFSWVVEGDAFVLADKIARPMGYVDDSLNQWVASLAPAQREGFVNALFSVLSAAGEQTFQALSENWRTALPAMLERLSALEPGERSDVGHALAALVRAFAPDVQLPQVGASGVGELARSLRERLPGSGPDSRP